MTTSVMPRLCGGIFFVLLLQARKQNTKVRSHYSEDTDGLSDTNMLAELIRIINPHFKIPSGKTFNSNTSSYKSCSISHGAYLPFDDLMVVNTFDARIKSNYSVPLSAMSEFTNTFIDTDTKYEWLVKALSEVIENDISIKSSDLFYIRKDGGYVTKSELCSVENICFQSFLLGIWHFIIINRPDNTIGRTTYEKWHKKPETKGQPWKFISNIGADYFRTLKIEISDISENSFEETAYSSKESFPENKESSQPDTFPVKDLGTAVNQTECRNTVTVHANTVNNTLNYILPSTQNADISVTSSKRAAINCDYYNLFVGSEDFLRRRFIVSKDRALTEYIEDDIKAEFSGLSDKAVAKIKSFPSIFASENIRHAYADENHMAVYGFVADIKIQENGIKIYTYPICLIQQQRLNEIAFKIGIQKPRSFNELNRNHWTIKKINLIEELKDAGIDVHLPTL